MDKANLVLGATHKVIRNALGCTDERDQIFDLYLMKQCEKRILDYEDMLHFHKILETPYFIRLFNFKCKSIRLQRRKTSAAAIPASGSKYNGTAVPARISLAERLAAFNPQNDPVSRLKSMDIGLYLRGLPHYNRTLDSKLYNLDAKLYDSMADGIWDELEFPDDVTSCTVSNYIYYAFMWTDDDSDEFYKFKLYQRFYERSVKPFAKDPRHK